MVTHGKIAITNSVEYERLYFKLSEAAVPHWADSRCGACWSQDINAPPFKEVTESTQRQTQMGFCD